jgi:integrase
MPEYTLKHKSDGTPYVRMYIGKSPLGEPIRKYRTFPGMTDDEARAAIQEWVAAFSKDPGASVTLGEAIETYIIEYDAAGHSPNTIETYTTFSKYFDRYWKRALGEVTTPMLNSLFVDLREKGVGNGPLSARTVHGARAFLSAVYNHYVRAGIVSSNPVKGTLSQVGYSHEAQAFSEYDVAILMDEVQMVLETMPAMETKEIVRRNVAQAIDIAIHTGLRVGEVCALRRRDASLGQKAITVGGTVCDTPRTGVQRRDCTKSGKSRRVAITPELVEHLRDHMTWQDGYIEEPTGNTPLITANGKYWSPRSLGKSSVSFMRDCGVSEGTFHTLRHTHATHLLMARIDPKTVQERLGHADVAMTLRLYGHVMPGRDEQAAQTMVDLLNSYRGLE